MKYRTDRKGNPLSQLGYGCMRFSRGVTGIDFEKTEREVLWAVEHGVNYLDTAYIYPGSEECLGKILEKNGLRDRINLATKLPQYLLHNIAGADRYFAEELKRLRTDHIDYYLMHMFTDCAEWDKLKAMGMEEWIAARKAEGSIRNIGFSYHGNTDMFLKILNDYDWDFCQIQYNYLDETSQAGRAGLQAAYGKGVPVIIMEPLRGGKLVRLPENITAPLRQSGRDWSNAEWGLRWLWNQPGVTCVLSGMNSLEMVQENVRIAAEAEVGCYTEKDFAAIAQVVKNIRAKEKVGCTGCRYCMPCPKGVDIPGNFLYYNKLAMEGKLKGRAAYTRALGLRSEPGFASRCVGCGKCEQHCPQHLPIREKLKEADRALRPPVLKAFINGARVVLKKDK